jgi:hypothetical protein
MLLDEEEFCKVSFVQKTFLPNWKKEERSWALVAHACNPSYSGSRDQEDHVLKPAWESSSQDPILKKPITKKKRVQLVGYLPSNCETQSSNHSITKKKKKKKSYLFIFCLTVHGLVLKVLGFFLFF